MLSRDESWTYSDLHINQYPKWRTHWSEAWSGGAKWFWKTNGHFREKERITALKICLIVSMNILVLLNVQRIQSERSSLVLCNCISILEDNRWPNDLINLWRQRNTQKSKHNKSSNSQHTLLIEFTRILFTVRGASLPYRSLWAPLSRLSPHIEWPLLSLCLPERARPSYSICSRHKHFF